MLKKIDSPTTGTDGPAPSRRTLLGGLLSAGVFGGAVASAAMRSAKAAPLPPESPQLLALGAEIEPRLQAYRAATERLSAAREMAASLWPPTPEEIVPTQRDYSRHDHRPFVLERDFEGNVVEHPEFDYDLEGGSGKIRGRLYSSKGVKEFLAETKLGPRTKWSRQLKSIDAAAEKYEAECAEAIERSGIQVANAVTRHSAYDLQELARNIAKYPPTTPTGISIYAHALMAYSEAEKHTYCSEGFAGAILGRGLADAVLHPSTGGRSDA